MLNTLHSIVAARMIQNRLYVDLMKAGAYYEKPEMSAEIFTTATPPILTSLA